MSTIYTYHFNNDGMFSCIVEKGNKKYTFKEDKAIQSLQLLDSIAFDRIQVFKHSIRLYKETTEIHIRDLDLFVEKQIDQYIPHLYKTIEKALKEYLYKEAKKKKRHNKYSKQIVTVSMGAVLMTLLLSSMQLHAEEETIGEIVVPIEQIHEEEIIEEPETETIEINQTTSINDFSLQQENMEVEQKNFSNSEVTTENLEVEVSVPNETEVISNDNNIQSNENLVYLNYEKTHDLVKKEYAFQEHEELANWCGAKWGMSPNLPLMQVTQESGGKGDNIMQIVWDK